MKKHKTTRVRVGAMNAQIDKLIVPLIKQLWKHGILTTNSCQENQPGTIWIEFLNPYYLVEFLNIVAPIPTKQDLESKNFFDTAYCRMTRGGFGEWKYSFNVHNFGEDRAVADFDFFASVRFPQFDLPLIMSAFENLSCT